MNCSEIQDRLLDLAYGELPDDELRPLHQHLDECSECTATLERWRQATALLQTASRASDANDGVVVPGSVFFRATQQAKKSRRRWRRLAAVSLLAASLALGWVVLSPTVGMTDSELTVTWSQPAPAALPDVADEDPKQDSDELRRLLDDQQHRLGEMDTLMKLVVAEIDADDERLRRIVLVMSQRMDELERDNNHKWSTVSRGMHDYYLSKLINHTVSDEEIRP